MTRLRSTLAAGAALILTSFAAGAVLAETTLLNVSYDPTRELYKDYNEVFTKEWKAKTGKTSRLTSRMAAQASKLARSSTVSRLTW